jgi:hypothetical protein
MVFNMAYDYHVSRAQGCGYRWPPARRATSCGPPFAPGMPAQNPGRSQPPGSSMHTLSLPPRPKLPASLDAPPPADHRRTGSADRRRSSRPADLDRVGSPSSLRPGHAAADWARPLSTRSALVIVLGTTVTVSSYRFLVLTGHRMRIYRTTRHPQPRRDGRSHQGLRS